MNKENIICYESSQQFEARVLKLVNHMKTNHMGYLSLGLKAASELTNQMLNKNGVFEYSAKENVGKKYPHLVSNITVLVSNKWLANLNK